MHPNKTKTDSNFSFWNYLLGWECIQTRQKQTRILAFGMTCWGGNASEQDKGRLDKNLRKADGVAGRRQESIVTAYHRLVTNKLDSFG